MHRFTTLLPFAALIAAPAAAGESHSWRVGNSTYNIYSTGLRLNTAIGRAQMLARVERVADKMCESVARVRVAQRRCAEEIVREAIATPVAAPLRLALAERDSVRFAAR